MAGAALLGRLTWLVAGVVGAVQETPRVRTLVLEAEGWAGHRAGQHVDVRLTAEDGYQAERSYSIASAPGEPLAITVEELEDVIYRDELDELGARGDGLEVAHTLTREQPPGWTGFSRRIDRELLSEVAWPASESPRVYVCGSTRFVDAAADGLLELGYDPRWIRTERFGATGS